MHEMPGENHEVICHGVNILPGMKPIWQKKRSFLVAKDKAISEEIILLFNVGFIEPCHYPKWLANVVMVSKPYGKWRMCADWTNLNDTYPKDYYPLPRIDQIVDAICGNAFLSFVEANFGYHFVTNQGVYNYNVMPFGLKNVRATFQRLMDDVFKKQKGRIVEIYVDDAIVKTKTNANLIPDLQEMFEIIRINGLWLNPKKCVFGVKFKHFLG